MPLTAFYDIESLRNIFTLCNFKDYANCIDVYILCDDSQLVDLSDIKVRQYIANRIYAKNKSFHGIVNFYDLHNEYANVMLINEFGACDEDFYAENSDNTFAAVRGYKPFVKDTDTGYNNQYHPYVLGYNSFNYDDTMLALYFCEVYPKLYYDRPVMFKSTTASMMRDYNNDLFQPMFKDKMPSYLRSMLRADSVKRNMQRSGRHIDVAKLNEKQQKVGLKRILGMLGYQILESDKLSNNQDRVNSLDDIADLIAYNCSDVVNLKKVFNHKVYKNNFNLKLGLLKTYPELIYQRKVARDENGNIIYENNRPVLLYEPDIAPDKTLRNRLYIDSSSSQLASRALCPYGELDDIAAVSFLYPSEKNALELNIPRVNVLEECRMFFYNMYSDPEIRKEFDRVYNYYKSLEGRNFNEADNYNKLYNAPNAWSNPDKARNMREYQTYLDDYNLCRQAFNGNLDDLRRINCWTSPKTGIQYHASAFMDRDEWKFDAQIRDLQHVMSWFKTPQNMLVVQTWTSPLSGRLYTPSDFITCNRWKTPAEMYYPSSTFWAVSDIPKTDTTLVYFDKDGMPSSCYVIFSIGGIHGAEYNKALYEHDLAEYTVFEQDLELAKETFPNPCDLKRAKKWISPSSGIAYSPSAFLKSGATLKKAEWKDISKKKPELFKLEKDGACKLNAKYCFTSSALSNHEDFCSYYPSMLIRMSAFWNDGLGYDRYKEIFGNKEKYGKLMKDKSRPESERADYANLREGTKLILNSASGAGDASFYTPIRMNNNITSMRLIGQLFTWRIGQAQTYQGASIISTNTDGLYSVMEKDINAKILAHEADNIHVEIEPELCYLISKDSNNRMEEDENHNIISASGGSLACRGGATPTKSLAHPAIIDWALCEYLRNADGVHASPDFMSEDFNHDSGRKILDKAKTEFDPRQYLAMFQNVIASSTGSNTYIFATDQFGGTKILQHYNRIFLVKDSAQTSEKYHLASAVARVVTANTKAKRARNNEREIQHDSEALRLLTAYGLPESEIPFGKEAAIKKVTGIEPNWFAVIENRAYEDMSDAEVTTLIDMLAIDLYLGKLAEAFDNWRNVLPDVTTQIGVGVV